MKLYKLCAVLGAAALILGLIISVFALSFGGMLHDSFGVHYGNDGHFSIGYWDHDEDDDKENVTNLSSFQNLDMDISIGDITIKQGDELKLYSEHLDSDDYEIIQDDDTLKIVSRKEQFALNLFIPDYHYTLIIPKDMKLKSLTVNSALGDVEVKQIIVDDIDIEQAMGDVTFDHVTYHSLRVDQKMGDVDYEGKGQGDMDIDNSMGDISINIFDHSQYYAYDLSTSMGSITTDTETADGASQTLKKHPQHARYQLTMDCSMGDIDLEFDDDFD